MGGLGDVVQQSKVPRGMETEWGRRKELRVGIRQCRLPHHPMVEWKKMSSVE